MYSAFGAFTSMSDNARNELKCSHCHTRFNEVKTHVQWTTELGSIFFHADCALRVGAMIVSDALVAEKLLFAETKARIGEKPDGTS
jgi:hypothetical protein